MEHYIILKITTDTFCFEAQARPCQYTFSGGKDSEGKYRDEIYQLDTDTHSWVEVGRMKTRRAVVGLSVINYNSVAEYCEPIQTKSESEARHPDTEQENIIYILYSIFYSLFLED